MRLGKRRDAALTDEAAYSAAECGGAGEANTQVDVRSTISALATAYSVSIAREDVDRTSTRSFPNWSRRPMCPVSVRELLHGSWWNPLSQGRFRSK